MMVVGVVDVAPVIAVSLLPIVGEAAATATVVG